MRHHMERFSIRHMWCLGCRLRLNIVMLVAMLVLLVLCSWRCIKTFNRGLDRGSPASI